MNTRDKLQDVMGYICSRYPYPEDLSKARLTKLIFLSDWKMALSHGRTITDIAWRFNHYGPYVRDVERSAYRSPKFDVIDTVNAYGSPKEVIAYVGPEVELPDDEATAIDEVVRVTQQLNFAEFLSVVYGTYPVENSQRYSTLDLVSMADVARGR